MTLYSSPPRLRSFDDDKPTLLVCWWATIFSAVIIALRVSGRFVRTERLFREDKTAALALVPLFLRMGCVHYILVHGTNNAQFRGVVLSEEELRGREVASGLVLASRVLYASILWIFKITIVEFFRRLTDHTWERSSRQFLNYLYGILLLTFIAVVISDLVECRPFSHHWQVLPDPGPQCRQSYAHLLTLATTNVCTDLLLVFFPIPIIIHSAMPLKRKVQLILLFSLSLAMVATAIYRVPHTIRKHGSQQFRSLMASVEILFAATAANALVLGSFVRDRGIKKPKFRYGSEDLESAERRDSEPRGVPTLQRHWGSDEDLVRGLGIAVKPELRQPGGSEAPRRTAASGTVDMAGWEFPRDGDAGGRDERSEDTLLSPTRRGSNLNAQKQLSFFDVGGLLDRETGPPVARPSDATPPPPAAAHLRRGSAALLQDLGGFLSFSGSSRTRSQSVSAGPSNESESEGRRPATPELRDVGGLSR